jgi:apolipoprotein N-acyltransferase
LIRHADVSHDPPDMTITLRRFGPAVLCGILLALTFPTMSIYPLAWIVLAPLFLQAARVPRWESAVLFFVCGLVFHLMLLQWLVTNIYWAGGWAVIGYTFLCCILAAFWMAVGFAWRAAKDALPRHMSPVVLAVLWAAMEFAQSRLFTGFGWSALGYSQAPNLWVAQWASIGGVCFVSAIVIFVNAMIAESIAPGALKSKSIYAAVALAAAVAAHLLGGALMENPDYDTAPFRAGIFQSNFPLEMKWDPEYGPEMRESAIQKSQELLAEADIDLFVWPEALVMEDVEEPLVLSSLQQFARDTGASLFAGAARSEAGTGRDRNSSVLVTPAGETDFYDKIHLAPFGEYVPLSSFLPFIGKIIPAIGDMEPGDQPKTFNIGDRTIGPLICFEVLFGNMAKDLQKRGANILIVITNLGWFGHSNAIPQELEIARMRAIETRLPLIHAANTGISGVFDPWGRFSVVNRVFDKNGNLLQVDVTKITVDQTITERMGGNLPVAAPGKQVVRFGPLLFPWFAVFASIAILTWSYIQRVRDVGPTLSASAGRSGFSSGPKKMPAAQLGHDAAQTPAQKTRKRKSKPKNPNP